MGKTRGKRDKGKGSCDKRKSVDRYVAWRCSATGWDEISGKKGAERGGGKRKKGKRTRRGKDGREIRKKERKGGKDVRESQPVSTILPSFGIKYFYSAVIKE